MTATNYKVRPEEVSQSTQTEYSLFNHCQQFTNEGVHAWEKELIDI